MNNSEAEDKLLHALIDELIIHIDMLKKSPDDAQMTELLSKRFVRFGQILNTAAYTELSELAGDINNFFCKAYNHSAYATQKILRAALSFLALVRKAVMFSDMPDFKETAGAMVLDLREALQELSKNTGIEKIKLPDVKEV